VHVSVTGKWELLLCGGKVNSTAAHVMYGDFRLGNCCMTHKTYQDSALVCCLVNVELFQVAGNTDRIASYNSIARRN